MALHPHSGRAEASWKLALLLTGISKHMPAQFEALFNYHTEYLRTDLHSSCKRG